MKLGGIEPHQVKLKNKHLKWIIQSKSKSKSESRDKHMKLNSINDYMSYTMLKQSVR